MKITIYVGESSEGARTERMVIDGEEQLSVYPLCECPEDALIERSLVSCSDVVKYMQMAYEVAKRGEEFTVEEEEEEDDA